MQSMIRSVCFAHTLCIGFVLMAVNTSLLAQGFRNPPEGARAVGAYGGYMAFASDADAAIHNPANLVELDRPVLQLNVLTGYGRNRFVAGSGIRQHTENPVFAIPGLSAAIPIYDKTALGLAVYVPYGRSVEWSDDGYFARNGLPYAGRMTVANITPSIAYRILPALSIAAGADIYLGTVRQDSRIFGLDAIGLPSGTRSRLDADGESLGWHLAATLRLPCRQRLAATVRSPFSIDYDGQNELGASLRSDVSARIEYPTTITLAYGLALGDALVAEVNVEWLEFSRYQNLIIRDQLLGTIVSATNQEDVWTYGMGLQWTIQPQWTLRAGYKYLENPTPDATYSPLTPDENQGVVSIGCGYDNGRHLVDLGYAYGLFDGRTIPETNPAAGTYDFDVHLVSLSYGIRL